MPVREVALEHIPALFEDNGPRFDWGRPRDRRLGVLRAAPPRWLRFFLASIVAVMTRLQSWGQILHVTGERHTYDFCYGPGR